MSIAPEAQGISPAISQAISPEVSALEVEFDGAEAGACEHGGPCLPLRRLAGAETECWFRPARAIGEKAGFRLFAADDLLLGWSVQPVDGDVERAAGDLYRRLLSAAGPRSLCRIWNYVPAINGVAAGLENYCAFNAGRARAFAERFGSDSIRHLPSASAVGCPGGALTALFVAAPLPPRHIENPEQIPAYRYPREHGPASPSFARATLASWRDRPLTFISGTAAIKGHATVAPGSLAAQIDCTLDNLRLISRAAGAGDDLGASRGAERHFKVYLRHAGDLGESLDRLGSFFFRPEDRVVWLEADLCRASLNIEIEATLLAAAR
jgi:chorismate lyase/3-hydroxybenzoate synthase